MRNIEVLRNYFLGKDPQLKETLADNSLRLIGIEGKHFVLRTELIQKLKELKDYVDEKDQELAEAIQSAIEALDGDIRALRTDLGTETTNRENADIIIRSVADSALDLAEDNEDRINGINDRVTNIEAWKDTWENPSEYVLIDDLIARLSDYYTKAQVDSLIASIPTLTYEVVQTLPTQDISTRTIYLVPSSDPELGNNYEEYMYIGNTWELIGTTAVDLSDYVTKSGLAQTTGSATNNAMSQDAVTRALSNKENLLVAGNNILITQGLPNTLVDVDGKTLQIYPDANAEFTVSLLDANSYQVRQGQIIKLIDLTPEEEEQEQVTGNRYTITSPKAIVVVEAPDQDNMKKATIYDGTYIAVGEGEASSAGLVSWVVTNNVDGEVIKPITDTAIRIWNMDEGAYKLSNTTIKYNGSTNNDSITVAGGYLFIYSLGTKKAYYIMSDNLSDAYFYIGQTSSDSGTITRLMKKDEIRNNLTTLATGYMLDASQGAILNNLIQNLSNEIEAMKIQTLSSTSITLGNLTEGVYKTTDSGTITITYASNKTFTIQGRNYIFITKIASGFVGEYTLQYTVLGREIHFGQCIKGITTNGTHYTTSDYETLVHKVTAIGSSSTDDEYPSAKAVYDAIQSSGGPTITYGTTDLTPGVSPLADGEFYFVYS